MSRTEIAAWTLALIALVWHSAAKGDHLPTYYGHSSARHYAGPPVGETFALAVDLSREAAALAREAKVVLCDCDDYDDVVDELEDLCRELEDLHCSLREATYSPRKWRKVRKRAEDVQEEVCELSEEISEAVRDLRRHAPRGSSLSASRRSPYRSVYRSAREPQLVLNIGRGVNIRFASDRGLATALPYTEPYVNRSSALGAYIAPPVDLGCELETRAQRMHAMADEIVRLSCIR